ncbi:MAG: hypothetical protein GY847_33965 [Proteobacteria bacterium]|nr:hypothetical protein [Pseudomonadota bacterium]
MIKMLKSARFRKMGSVGLGFLIVLGVYTIISTHFRRVGLMVPDESYYALAARAVYEGKIPYRDFAYMQMPLLPYINGLMLSLIGYGLDNHRFVNFIWGGIGLVVLISVIRQRLGRWEPAFVAAFAVAASPRWGFLQSMGSWCGVAGMFLIFALAAVLWRAPVGRRVLPFAISGTISIGCRLSGAPVVAVLAVILLLEADGLKERLKVLAICLGVGTVTFLPFFIAAPEEFYFMNWQYHMESQVKHLFSTKALQAWDISPAAIVIQAIGLLGLRILIRKKKWSEIILLSAGIVGLITPMIPKGAWGTYISSSVPIASTAGVIAMWTAGMAVKNPHRHVLWAFPLMSLFHMTPLEVPEGAATEVEEIAAFISVEVEDGPLLTPANIIAVEAGREAIKGTEMGKFSAMLPWEEERAKLFHMTTLTDLTEVVDAQEPAAIILVVEPKGWRVWNFHWALPSWKKQPYLYIKEFEDKIEECYKPVWLTSTMEVFIRR